MTLSDERLKLLDKIQKLRADKQRYASAVLFDGRELNVMAEALLDRAIEDERELLSRRASPHGEAGVTPEMTAATHQEALWQIAQAAGIGPNEVYSVETLCDRIRSALLPTPSVETGRVTDTMVAALANSLFRDIGTVSDDAARRALEAALSTSPGSPGLVRNESAGFYEFVSEDVPTTTGPVRAANVEPILRMGKPRGEVIGFRVWDASPGSSAGAEPVAFRSKELQTDPAWELTPYRPTAPGIIIEPLYAAPPQREGLEEAARPIIEAAFSGALTLSIGSCTCGVKSQNIEFHDVGCHYRIATKLLDDLSALRAAARVAPEPVAANRLLRDETTEWQTDRADGTVTVHSRMIDGVLCRWWGDGAPPAGVAKIDAALYASPSIASPGREEG